MKKYELNVALQNGFTITIDFVGFTKEYENANDAINSWKSYYESIGVNAFIFDLIEVKDSNKFDLYNRKSNSLFGSRYDKLTKDCKLSVVESCIE